MPSREPKPRSIRAFMLWERHVIGSSRMLVEDFFPAPAAKVVLGFERLTGRPFPKLKPRGLTFEALDRRADAVDAFVYPTGGGPTERIGARWPAWRSTR